jgi:hypothetical protein
MKHLLITASLMILAFIIASPIGVRQAEKRVWENQLECFTFPKEWHPPMALPEATPSAVVIPTTVTVKGEPVDQWELLKDKPAGVK